METANNTYQEQYASDIFENVDSTLTINGISINTIYPYNIDYKSYARTSDKQKLTMVQCKGQCLCDREFHTCKLLQETGDFMIAQDCPYAYNVIQINEPRKNSKPAVFFKYLCKYLKYRLRYGKYADWLSQNDHLLVSDELYEQLKHIPEFSLKNCFRCDYDLEELKEKIREDNTLIWHIYMPQRHYSVALFTSLKQHYEDELSRYKEICNCRMLLDKETSDYLNWRDNQPEIILEIGDYYFVNSNYIFSFKREELPDFIFRQEKSDYNRISFLKQDLAKVYDWASSRAIMYNQNVQKYFVERLEKLLHPEDYSDDDNNKLALG